MCSKIPVIVGALVRKPHANKGMVMMLTLRLSGALPLPAAQTQRVLAKDVASGSSPAGRSLIDEATMWFREAAEHGYGLGPAEAGCCAPGLFQREVDGP